MFQTGDIVYWHEDSEFWVIIESNMSNELDCNTHSWRIRRKNDNGRLPKCMVAFSCELYLACRPIFFADQKLIFHKYIVNVIKDAGTRVKCEIIGMSDCSVSDLLVLNGMIGRKIEILKSALVESSILLLNK